MSNPPSRSVLGVRIAKVLADMGLCSRREAERWISEGRVAVAGKRVETPAFFVTPDDPITLDGRLLKRPKPALPRVWLFHKPKGLVTTHKDPQGRPTVFAHLHQIDPKLPRVCSVGRLDLNSEGLLILSTSGALIRYMESPRTAWIRRYKVRVFGTHTPEQLNRLTQGISVDGVSYALSSVEVIHGNRAQTWLNVTLKTGKNREIRRLFEAIGLKVSRLIRTHYGPFQLGDLAKGALTEIKAPMIKATFPEDLVRVDAAPLGPNR